MSNEIIYKSYLKIFEFLFSNSEARGLTAELSFRPILNNFFEQISFQINSEIGITYEPRNQANAGRPDWRFFNKKSLGVYGYVEAKGLVIDKPLRISKHKDQISKYLSLGYKIIFTDGIEFVFFEPAANKSESVQLVAKELLNKGDWENLEINFHFESKIREFFSESTERLISEKQLIKESAKRARNLQTDILELVNLESGEGINENENNSINILHALKEDLLTHHDPDISNNRVFSAFVAQVLIFGSIYAHRVIIDKELSPKEKYHAIINFWNTSEDKPNKNLRPFKELHKLLKDELQTLGKIGTWYEDNILLLSHIKIDRSSYLNPNYHILYEDFLTEFDPETKFSFGAYYTPIELSAYATKLTINIFERFYNSINLNSQGTKIIDPCCGTGNFIEQLLLTFENKLKAHIVGFEILPAPYVLANYRVEQLKSKSNVDIILTNTLSDELESPTREFPENVFRKEQNKAHELSAPPITLVIGNPPVSDSGKPKLSSDNFSSINNLVEDFRPPKNEIRSRQNTQKQLKNDFVRFLRWSCNKIELSDIGIFSLVLPSAFLTHISYKYARKWIASRYKAVYVLEIDSDHRRKSDSASNLFNTRQGRALLIGLYDKSFTNSVGEYYYNSISQYSKLIKSEILNKNEPGIGEFTRYEIDQDSYQLRPAASKSKKESPNKSFDELYSRFWPIALNNENNDTEGHIFERHCSGIKLAPSSIFIHVNENLLFRRTKELADTTRNFSALMKTWFAGQSKPPREDKLNIAIRNKIEKSIVSDGKTFIKNYSFRPFLNLKAYMDPSLLQEFARLKNSGTRFRPEIISAYGSTKKNFGIAIAPAPADLGDDIFRFCSFSWNMPDNDLASRGNAHVYCPFFPLYKPNAGKKWNNSLKSNISQRLLKDLKLLSIDVTEYDIIFYCYAILSSKSYLTKFWIKLHSVAGGIPRIPITKNNSTFRELIKYGELLASYENVEEADVTKNKCYSADSNRRAFVKPFKLGKHKIEGTNNLITLYDTEENVAIRINIPSKEILTHIISGYNIIQQWLKFYSYNYTRTEISEADYFMFLKFLDCINIQIEIIKKIDIIVDSLLLEGRLLPPF